MRPPILRWKVVIALVVVVVVGAALGSSLGPSGKAYSSSGVQYFLGSGMKSAHTGTVHIYRPGEPRRTACGNMRAELKTVPKSLRHAFMQSMRDMCKRR